MVAAGRGPARRGAARAERLQKWPHQMEQELRKRLERTVASRLDLCGVKGVAGASFVLRSSTSGPTAARPSTSTWRRDPQADLTGGKAKRIAPR